MLLKPFVNSKYQIMTSCTISSKYFLCLKSWMKMLIVSIMFWRKIILPWFHDFFSILGWNKTKAFDTFSKDFKLWNWSVKYVGTRTVLVFIRFHFLFNLAKSQWKRDKNFQGSRFLRRPQKLTKSSPKY